MFNFFNRKKPTIQSVSIPGLGWTQIADEPHVRKWMNTTQTAMLALNFFEKAPDIPSIQKIDAIRDFYRKLVVQANGGIVEVSLIAIGGFAAIKTIFKFPQTPSGMTYLGSVTIPFRDCSYVVKVEAMEMSPTGMRDGIILDQMLEQKRVHFKNDIIQGWMADPYDPSFQGGKLMNLSEDAAHDAAFPNHPLSLVRKSMAQLEKEMTFGDELGKMRPFPK